MLSNKTYDTLKFLCTLLIPGIGAVYFGLSQIWGFPFGEEISGSCNVIATFIGGLIGISSAQYWKGVENNGNIN